MKIIYLYLTLLFFLIPSFCHSGETITAQETEGYCFADGKMERSNPQFEITYYLEGDKITRTRVYDMKQRKVIPDNTIYTIVKNLQSDPTVGLSITGKSVIRAIGKPGTDAIELLVIGNNYVQFVKSTSDYFVISRSKILK